MQNAATQEQARLWRAHDLGNLELLRATYLTHSFARHAHAEFMIGVIEQGACAFYYRGATHGASAGSVVLINPGEVHDGHGNATTSLTYRALYPDAAILQQIASERAGRQRGIPYFSAPVIDDEPSGTLVRSLHMALEVSTSPLERESRFLWTFTHLIGRYAEHRSETPGVGREHLAVKRAQEYLEAYPSENVSLARLASIANLSPFHLLRVFRAELGLPPHAYLTQVRVARAKTLLALGMPIPAVAFETGFVDQSHLTRHFKRMVGVTPGQYCLGSKNVQDRSFWLP